MSLSQTKFLCPSMFGKIFFLGFFLVVGYSEYFFQSKSFSSHELTAHTTIFFKQFPWLKQIFTIKIKFSVRNTVCAFNSLLHLNLNIFSHITQETFFFLTRKFPVLILNERMGKEFLSQFFYFLDDGLNYKRKFIMLYESVYRKNM